MLSFFRVWDHQQQKMMFLGKDFHYLTPKGVASFSSQSMKNGSCRHDDIVILLSSGTGDAKGNTIYSGDILSSGRERYLVYYCKNTLLSD